MSKQPLLVGSRENPMAAVQAEQSNSRRRSSVTHRRTSLHGDVSVTYQRSRSNPLMEKKLVSPPPVTSRLERRRSAVTFPSTYKTLIAPSRSRLPNEEPMTPISCDGGCFVPPGWKRRKNDWSTLVHCLTHKRAQGRRISPTEVLVRKSLECVTAYFPFVS